MVGLARPHSDLNHDQVSFLNPTYFHECHRFDLHFYFESEPFFETLDSAFPFRLPKADTPPATASFSDKK
jgi:hypothetical protein